MLEHGRCVRCGTMTTVRLWSDPLHGSKALLCEACIDDLVQRYAALATSDRTIYRIRGRFTNSSHSV